MTFGESHSSTTWPISGPNSPNSAGKTFDKAYIDNEVAYHKAVDSALESTLIPNASNAKLKDLPATGLKIFQGHEQMDRMLNWSTPPLT